MGDILNEIIAYKRIEVARRKEEQPEITFINQKSTPAALDFQLALKNPRLPGKISLIAEIKKASPSKGLIAPDFDPVKLAKAYEGAGASALSVLTDEKFFMGHLSYMPEAKAAAGGKIPVLRKDFIIDPYQVYEARANGADAILLIVAALDDRAISSLFKLVGELGMQALVEVHDEAELERALRLGAKIIGINNRNLRTFEVSLKTTERLMKNMPGDVVAVSESGIGTRQDILELESMGVSAVLVGETLMRAATTPAGLDTAGIGQKIREMFGE